MTSTIEGFEEAEITGVLAMCKRTKKYNDVLHSLYCSYIQRIASECDRIMTLFYKAKNDILNEELYFTKIENFFHKLGKGNKEKKLKKVQGYAAYECVRKLDNFLKHHTPKSYRQVEKFCKDFLVEKDTPYELGMYAPNWLCFPENYIEDVLDKLDIFFVDLCHRFFEETPEEAEWNNDEYFLNVYEKIRDPDVYLGITDKYGNSLVG